jgi:hypothetical protein
MAKAKSTFEVDKKGLGKLLERRGGKHFALLELFQNAVDEDGVTKVDMTLANRGDGSYELTVEDNSPEGFKDLTHAYTLFAESEKKKRADQRGRFNLGEKLVIAVCDYVQIGTTKGVIEFTDEGRIEHLDGKMRESGSMFLATLQMTEEEAAKAEEAVDTLLVPGHIDATFNGRELEKRIPLRTFEVTLRTEQADAEGYLRPTRRKTKVSIYEPRESEVPHLYEMGIPVVDTEDRWHVDVGQKVPLNTDRDNVPPGWLRDVRVAVLNNCADLLKPEDAKAKWVDDAIEDEDVQGEALEAVVKGRYGDKAVIEDRTDPEGTKIAMQKGYTVIPGGAFSKTAWSHVKQHETVKPAGQVTPSPNPNIGDDELKLMEPDHWPEGVREIAAASQEIARRVIGREISVRIVTDITWPFAATYGGGQLTYNYGRLGHAFFDNGLTPRVLSLLNHELAHERVSDHLTEAYYDECNRLAGLLAVAAAEDPGLILDRDRFRPKTGIPA